MKYLFSGIIGLLFFCFAFEALAQDIPRSPRRDPLSPVERVREMEDYERRRAKEDIDKSRKQKLLLDRELPERKIGYSEKSLTSVQKKLLEPAPDDYLKFANFLRQPDTGLIRLMPKGKYESDGTISASDPNMDKLLPIPGAGAFYSFTKKTHVLGPNSDISLADDVFYSGFAEDVLGLAILLGDVPLESVDSNSQGVDSLASFAPPTSRAEMIKQLEKNTDGFRVGNHSFRSTLIALPNMTYAMRSTAYDRSDILIAFRVVRQDDDGSLIILWKKLQEFQKSKLK
jgi:hypothetical protein